MKNALSALGIVVVLFILSRDKSIKAVGLILLIGFGYFILRQLKDYIRNRKEVEQNGRNK